MNRTKYAMDDYRRYGNNPNAPLLEAKSAAFALTANQLADLHEHCARLLERIAHDTGVLPNLLLDEDVICVKEST